MAAGENLKTRIVVREGPKFGKKSLRDLRAEKKGYKILIQCDNQYKGQSLL